MTKNSSSCFWVKKDTGDHRPSGADTGFPVGGGANS